MTARPTHQLLLVCVVITLLTTPALAVSGYSLTGSNAMAVPAQTITYENRDITVDSISQIGADESVTVTTDVPADTSYDLQLRGPDGELISNQRKTGDVTRTYSYFGSGEAGTYAAIIHHRGDPFAIHPIVIAGYDVAVSTPETVETGDEVTITATVTERSVETNSPLKRVDLVVGNGDVEKHQRMSEQDDGTYATTIDTEELSAATYDVYVVVRGEDTVFGEAEMLGISDTAELPVTEQSDGSARDESDASDTDAGETATDSPGADGAAGDGEAVTPATSDGDEMTPATGDENGITTETSTDETNVISPSTPTADTPTTASSSVSLFTILALLAVVASALIVARYRD